MNKTPTQEYIIGRVFVGMKGSDLCCILYAVPTLDEQTLNQYSNRIVLDRTPVLECCYVTVSLIEQEL